MPQSLLTLKSWRFLGSLGLLASAVMVLTPTRTWAIAPSGNVVPEAFGAIAPHGIEIEPDTEFLLSQTATLRQGDSGDAVRTLQNNLTRLGFYNGPISGFFGDLTKAAVIAFQQSEDLTADGIVGSGTQAAIQTALTAANNTPSTTGALRLGDSGDRVRQLQEDLAELDYYNGTADGIFGSSTQAAVIAFQQASGLTADGIVGSGTQSAIQTALNASPPSTTPPASDTLRLGDNGPRVVELQTRLTALRYYTGTADGVFGVSTQTAVIAFQQRNNLTADGIVGPATTNALRSNNAIPAAASGSGSGSSGSGSSGSGSGTGTGSSGSGTGTNTGNSGSGTGTNSGSSGSGTGTNTGSSGSGSSGSGNQANVDRGRFSVYELQQRLRDRGFYNGTLDGIMGPATRDAIAAAQQAYDLSEDDIIRGEF
jgi:peptidoglycan hydrolase-like protein with peptidoglycan-binding domain